MKPVERQSFSNLLGNSFYFCLFYFYFMFMLQSRMLEATRKQCGYVKGLQIFGVFQAAFMGSKVSRTVEICVSKLFQMAESPKAVVVESENVTTPQEEARGSVPDVEAFQRYHQHELGGHRHLLCLQ